MDEVSTDARITWGSRDFANNMTAAATREDLPLLAQLVNRVGELARVRGLWNEETLKHLYGLAGCLLAVGRPADALGAADLLASKQAERLQWGEMYHSNAEALRAQALTLLRDKKEASHAQRRIGRPMPASEKDIARRWNESLRMYRADFQRAHEHLDGLERILEAGHIHANLVKSLLTAPSEFEDRVDKAYAETGMALRRFLASGASSSRLAPVKPEPKLGTPVLGAVFQPKAVDPKLVRQFKDRIQENPSFRSEPMLQAIIDLTWMLYSLDRADEASAVIETVLDYYRDDEKFVFHTEEGMQAVKLAALLRKEVGNKARLEQYRAVLDKLQEITEQVRERNRRVDKGAPDPRQASRRILEEIIPRNLDKARVEPRRVMAFALLRTSLDKVATALVREAYAGLSADRVRRYLTDGLEQFRGRIEKGR